MRYRLEATTQSKFFGWLSLICLGFCYIEFTTNKPTTTTMLLAIWLIIVAGTNCVLVRE